MQICRTIAFSSVSLDSTHVSRITLGHANYVGQTITTPYVGNVGALMKESVFAFQPIKRRFHHIMLKFKPSLGKAAGCSTHCCFKTLSLHRCVGSLVLSKPGVRLNTARARAPVMLAVGLMPRN